MGALACGRCLVSAFLQEMADADAGALSSARPAGADPLDDLPIHVIARLPIPSSSTPSASGASGSGGGAPAAGPPAAAKPQDNFFKRAHSARLRQKPEETKGIAEEEPANKAPRQEEPAPRPEEPAAMVATSALGSPAPEVLPEQPTAMVAASAHGVRALGPCNFCRRDTLPTNGTIIAKHPLRIQCNSCKRVDRAVSRLYGSIQFLRSFDPDQAVFFSFTNARIRHRAPTDSRCFMKWFSIVCIKWLCVVPMWRRLETGCNVSIVSLQMFPMQVLV